jgi:hypothetical protein
MAVFSPKARRLIDAAIADTGEPRYGQVWRAWVLANPDLRQPGERWEGATAGLPADVVVGAVYALEEMVRRILRHRERSNLSDDERSDIDNDLSPIKSVQRFLAAALS